MMRRFLINISKFSVLILLLATTSCKNRTEKSITDNNNTDELNKIQILGKHYNDAWNSKIPKNVASFYAPDGMLTVNKETPIVGIDQLTKFAKDFMTAFPDMKLTLDSLIIKKGRTEFHWTFVGTNTGQNGIGNTVNFSGFESWKINEEGLIQESIGTYDSDDYNRQVSQNVDN